MWKNILEENLEEKEDELMIILQNLIKKQSDLKQMNTEVIMLLDEEELENDVIQCEEIEYNIRWTIEVSRVCRKDTSCFKSAIMNG